MNTAAHPEHQYLDLLRDLLAHGDPRMDRTGVGTRAVFGRTMRFDLAQGFPVLTTKKVAWKTSFREMLWMLAGGRNIRPLLQQGVHIWTDWPAKKYREISGEKLSDEEFEARVLSDEAFAERWGDLGPIGYGAMWRGWPTYDGGHIDQVAEVVRSLKENPTSRRHIIEGWNVALLDQMALPPCHKTYQFFVSSDKRLSCSLGQRSVDCCAGLPFNLCGAALLTTLLAEQTGLTVGELVWTGGDTHLYNNHEAQARLQLTREPRAWPRLVIKRKPASIFDYAIEDFALDGYDPHPAIALEIAV